MGFLSRIQRISPFLPSRPVCMAFTLSDDNVVTVCFGPENVCLRRTSALQAYGAHGRTEGAVSLGPARPCAFYHQVDAVEGVPILQSTVSGRGHHPSTISEPRLCATATLGSEDA
jgi:hypothetical protein